MKRIVKQFDSILTEWILYLPHWLHSTFLVVTTLGDPVLTIAIGTIIAAVGVAQSNVRLAFSGTVVWITLGIGSLLKLIFGRARPLTEYAANLRVDTFSFPSGHSSGAMIAYGLIAYLAIRCLPYPWGIIVAVLCGCLIALIGVSRIYLGAHFPSDVIAGWLLGAFALFIIITFIKPLE